MSEFGIRCLHIDDASLLGTTSHIQGATFLDAGTFVVQGRGGKNPVNNQHSWVKNKDTVPLGMGGENPSLAEIPVNWEKGNGMSVPFATAAAKDTKAGGGSTKRHRTRKK